ncbi:MAG TPA: hypothetical protein VF163_16215 [Micromonosporaceae bacterium]
MDLTGAGFRLLFEAEWTHLAPDRTPPTGLRFRRVYTTEGLAAWAAAHGGGDTFRPTLLDRPEVALLAARDDSGGRGDSGTEDDGSTATSTFFLSVSQAAVRPR